MKYQQLDINKKEELKIIIYNLRKQGLTYEKIVGELERKGIKIAKCTVRDRCKKIFSSKGEIEPDTRRYRSYNPKNIESQKINETINELREQGLTYKEISDKFKEEGKSLTSQAIGDRYKKFLKLKEEQLARAILNLTITRKATLEQVQIIADYYGVDLEKTMNSLEER